MAAPNPWMERNRLAKVRAIVGVIDQLPDRPTSDEISKWGPDVWADMTGAALLKSKPSDETIALVVAHYREQEEDSHFDIDEYDAFEDGADVFGPVEQPFDLSDWFEGGR